MVPAINRGHFSSRTFINRIADHTRGERNKMTESGVARSLFPASVPDARRTGVLPYQELREMQRAKQIASIVGFESDQLQPASFDLRLGKSAYRVRASFLPGPASTVMEGVQRLDGLPKIDLEKGAAVFERGAVYVVELLESVALPADTTGVANPKSSTGRLDVLTRLITDRATAFDRIEPRYQGPLFLEVAPLTFPIVVRQGIRLSQVRFHRGVGALAQNEVQRYYAAGQLIVSTESPLPLRDGLLVPVTVDLLGRGPGAIVGYKAKENTNKIDMGLVGHYDPREFWDKIERNGGRLNLDKDDFYILATREDVGVPPWLAAEMVPYDTRSGEFRVHYAGFFDPGFGWVENGARGSKAVLEVRSYGVSFTLEHGQIVGWLRYSPIAGGATSVLYGTDVTSNYQGQGVALGKHFKPWPA